MTCGGLAGTCDGVSGAEFDGDEDGDVIAGICGGLRVLSELRMHDGGRYTIQYTIHTITMGFALVSPR